MSSAWTTVFVVAAFLAGLAHHVRVSELQEENTVLQQKLDKAERRAKHLQLHDAGKRLCGLPQPYLLTNLENHTSRVDSYEWLVRCPRSRKNASPKCRYHSVASPSERAAIPASIPAHIAQTGPPDWHKWPSAFTISFGSWQRYHSNWSYVFWNDTTMRETNPNTELFVARHVPWFLPAWRRLDEFVMRLDVARYMWLYVHGGVYADLDVQATNDMTPWLLDADVVLPSSYGSHETLKACWRHTRYYHQTQGRCGVHVGNWWMASKPGHPLWLEMLTYVSDNVEMYCNSRKRRDRSLRQWAILELTGPYALGRVLLLHLQKQPRSRIVLLEHPLPFARNSHAASWKKSPPPPPPAIKKGHQKGDANLVQARDQVRRRHQLSDRLRAHLSRVPHDGRRARRGRGAARTRVHVQEPRRQPDT